MSKVLGHTRILRHLGVGSWTLPSTLRLTWP